MTPRENLEPSGLALGSSEPIWDGNKMLNNLKSIAQVSGQITNRHVPLPVCTTSLTKKFSQTDIRLFFFILLNQKVSSVKVVESVLCAAMPSVYF